MNLRLPTPLIQKLSPERLVVLVIALGLSFVAVVLLPGLKLASELVDTSAALKWVGEQQRYPTVIRASLETMRDRLTDRGYIQESLDQLKDSSHKLDEAVTSMTAPRRRRLVRAIGLLGGGGQSTAGRHGHPWRRRGPRRRRSLDPVIAFDGLPYADSESAGSVLNAQGRELERNLTAAIRISRHSLPELDAAVERGRRELQAGNARAAKQLQLAMLLGLLIAAGLVAAHHAAAQCAPATGCEAARGAPTDGRHSAHREGRPVSARRESGHRQRLFERARDPVPAQGSSRGWGSMRCWRASSRRRRWPPR